ncbi:MAG: small subunit ribosomal protein [Abditibacteriota bacterium]|jgi:small subunit ribosomal protein S14|nr:small subunit ribosomal protein [Abditibacteriota bacterium]
MAKTSKIVKTKRQNTNVVFKARVKNRCNLCGRPRGYMRTFGICRICFRGMAHRGLIPGVTKSSW